MMLLYALFIVMTHCFLFLGVTWILCDSLMNDSWQWMTSGGSARRMPWKEESYHCLDGGPGNADKYREEAEDFFLALCTINLVFTLILPFVLCYQLHFQSLQLLESWFSISPVSTQRTQYRGSLPLSSISTGLVRVSLRQYWATFYTIDSTPPR